MLKTYKYIEATLLEARTPNMPSSCCPVYHSPHYCQFLDFQTVFVVEMISKIILILIFRIFAICVNFTLTILPEFFVALLALLLWQFFRNYCHVLGLFFNILRRGYFILNLFHGNISNKYMAWQFFVMNRPKSGAVAIISWRLLQIPVEMCGWNL